MYCKCWTDYRATGRSSCVPLFKYIPLILVTSHAHGSTHKYWTMRRAVTVVCFPGAQRLLTSRQADRKGVQSRWIEHDTATTLTAGTPVSNCPCKTAADTSAGACRSFRFCDLPRERLVHTSGMALSDAEDQLRDLVRVNDMLDTVLCLRYSWHSVSGIGCVRIMKQQLS